MIQSFGILPNGEEASLYTISCGSITAAITNYGAALVRLLVPDRAGNMADVVLGYESCITSGRNIVIRPGKVKYALMPVWVLSTQWKGKNFLFSMNGQTGKLIGDLPVDKGRLAMWCAGAFAIVSGLSMLLLLG